jgi:hypothetical protein
MPPHDDRPGGLSGSAQERLLGLGLIVCGIAGFGVIYLMWRYAPASMPTPPGLPRNLLPLVSPLNCILPVSLVTSSLLVLIGFRKLILGD